MVAQHLAGGDVLDVDLLPVAAVAGDGVAEVVAVVGDAERGEGHGAVVGELVGVEQLHGLAVKGVLVVEDALVLQTVVVVEEVAVALLPRRALLGVVQQVFQVLLHLLAVGNLRQELVGHRVLGLHPVGGLLGVVVLQPTVWVGHGHAEIVVHGVALLGFGILHLGNPVAFLVTGCQHHNTA